MTEQHGLRVLFITRKFPPAVGGMEKVAYELYKHLSKLIEVELIKWGGPNKFLPVILPYFLIKSCRVLLTKRVDVIYLQDGLLAPLGLILRSIFRKPVAITIHGLDITYKNKFYQFIVPRCVKRLDKIICISQATKQECVNRGIPEEKIVIIPNGISDEFYMGEDKNLLRKKLEEKLGIKLENRKIILSVGRLVERKGFHWFIENVLPKLVEKERNVIYLIAGDGPLRERIYNSIKKSGMESYAVMLGRVDDETLKLLYNTADVLVMPNIPVEGDMEGFGVVALEASSCGVPVVASNLEGVRDAIVEGENGFLVEVYSQNSYINLIIMILLTNKKYTNENIRKFTLENFNWDFIALKFMHELQELADVKFKNKL